MVRVILSPKSIERQFMKRVAMGFDRGIVREVLGPEEITTKPIVRVAFCEDFRGSHTSSRLTVQANLSTLYKSFGIRAEVHVSVFSFLATDQDAMRDLLRNADLFYFAGVHVVPATARLAMEQSGFVELLRERVQYNSCAYFGVCGGATMAGCDNVYSLPGLDFFDGVSVMYDAHISPAMASVRTSYESQLLQITSGCALALVATIGSVQGCSFPTIKNATQWLDFANQNTEEVNIFLARKVLEWKLYRTENQLEWYFNLRGLININGRMYIVVEINGRMYSVQR